MIIELIIIIHYININSKINNISLISIIIIVINTILENNIINNY